MLQLREGVGAPKRRDAVCLRDQRLQPDLPKLQGELQRACLGRGRARTEGVLGGRVLKNCVVPLLLQLNIKFDSF